MGILKFLIVVRLHLMRVSSASTHARHLRGKRSYVESFRARSSFETLVECYFDFLMQHCSMMYVQYELLHYFCTFVKSLLWSIVWGERNCYKRHFIYLFTAHSIVTNVNVNFTFRGMFPSKCYVKTQ
jgi:hypothetical protein